MSYKSFEDDYLKRGLLKKQSPDWPAIRLMIRRSYVDLSAAKKNLSIDAGVAYSVAYMAMVRAARAYMLSGGSDRPMALSIEL